MAAMTLEQWLTRLKPGETPIFDYTRDALAGLAFRGDNLSAREVSPIVLADPLATLRLIYSANNRSSRYGAEVTTVEHAILMQGVGNFIKQTLALPVLEDTPQGRDKAIMASLYRLARMAQHASWQARDFATLDLDTRAEELQVAAVLYYAPEFLFWLDAPDIAEFLAQARRKRPSVEAEEQVLGFALPPMRESLLEAWKIPDVIRDMLRAEDNGNTRRAILWASLGIAHYGRRGWWDDRLTANYQTLADIVHKPLDEIIAIVHGNALRSARAGHWVHATPAATWLPMQPGDWPAEKEPEPKASDPGETSVQDTHTVCPMPVRSVLDETLANIRQHLDGSFNLNQMLAVILKGLHTGLGLSRVMFALVTPDGKRVKCRFTLGITSDDPMRHFEFPLASGDLFGILMTKTQAVWINEENRGRLWPRISPELRAKIGHGDFYAMSLFANAKPVGLIYADRGHGDCALDTHTYEDFKKLCLEAAKGLGKVKSQ